MTQENKLLEIKMQDKSVSTTFILDGKTIPFSDGQTIIQAAMAAGEYIPHLCYNPEFKPHGSCKVCTVQANGRQAASCTQQAQADMVVESNTQKINDERRALLQMLFVEGNHFCPSCEKSGNCELQATAYALEMMSPHFDHFSPTDHWTHHTRSFCLISTAAFCVHCVCVPAATSMVKTCLLWLGAASEPS